MLSWMILLCHHFSPRDANMLLALLRLDGSSDRHQHGVAYPALITLLADLMQTLRKIAWRSLRLRLYCEKTRWTKKCRAEAHASKHGAQRLTKAHDNSKFPWTCKSRVRGPSVKCESLVQRLLLNHDRYYDGCIVHRVVKGFMYAALFPKLQCFERNPADSPRMQTGDPDPNSSNGSGGEPGTESLLKQARKAVLELSNMSSVLANRFRIGWASRACRIRAPTLSVFSGRLLIGFS